LLHFAFLKHPSNLYSLFDLSNQKLEEVDEYGELEVHQHEINIKRIDLVFQ
jgi:hypothetical protein